ncbi:MAG: hypothetical protein ACXWJZ_16955, partial [Burkholderiaceae bacterium]
MSTIPSELAKLTSNQIELPGKMSFNWRGALDSAIVPLSALLLTFLIFSAFVLAVGQNPLEVWSLMYQGAFADAFSWQNTLLRAAPLILTGLSVALPAQVGLVIIGGEGALVLGALAGAVAAQLVSGLPPFFVQSA